MDLNSKHFCILSNETAGEEELWVKACNAISPGLNVDIVNLTSAGWLQKLQAKKYDYLLAKPPGLTAPFKILYDERIFMIHNVLKLPVYPSPLEIYIYENKRFFYSWLAANRLPHPKTWIFYAQDEALEFLRNAGLPLVAKANIGASGSGVHILRSADQAEKYISQAFTTGAPVRWGPNLEKGGLLKRGFHYVLNPSAITKKLSAYKSVRNDRQIGFVLLQQFIPHDFEWRIVVIGDSYFAHKKMKIADKASGSLLKNYDNPPLKLFDFARKIMRQFGLFSQAIDAFEDADGNLVINEMQCIFGQSDSYQMLVDGKPGRYRFIENEWVFEAGDFNTNECYDLRLQHVLSMLKE